MKRILAVDDDAAILKVVRTHLERAGYAVRTEIDPKKVVEGLAAEPADLILLDVMMPGLDGLELCERIRAVDPDTPILFLTAKNAHLDVLAGYAAGGQAYVTKPFQAADLLEKVEYALAGRR